MSALRTRTRAIERWRPPRIQAFDLLFVVHDESKHKPMVFVTMASLTRQLGREYPEERPACASIARAEEVRHKFAIRCKQ